MIFDSLIETLLEGGWVLIPIFLVGFVALYLIFESYGKLGKDTWRKDWDSWFEDLKRSLDHDDCATLAKICKSSTGPMSKMMCHYMELGHCSADRLHSEFKARKIDLKHDLESGSIIIGVLASAAPLLGLLGTVSGMVSTFDVITIHGNSNPVLLAGGISEALLTTQSGLIIAFPLVLLKQRLEDRRMFIYDQIKRLEGVLIGYQEAREMR